MTYSSIVCGLLIRIQQQKTMDIKLPVPITDAKTMISFLTLHKLHLKKSLYQISTTCLFRIVF